MIFKDKIIVLLLEHYPNIVGVSNEIVDSLIKKYNIELRNEHRDFFINYGNSSSLLTSMFADCTFERFEQYYSAQFPFDEINDEEKLPLNTTYFGHDFNDEFLCIDNNTGEIFVYAFQEKSGNSYYENIDSFLMYCFFWHDETDYFFETVQTNIVINDLELFKKDNEVYKIKDIRCQDIVYYLNNEVLIEFDQKSSMCNLYKGGILNQLYK